MSTLHQRLYAYLAGQIDETIAFLENMIDTGSYDWTHTIQVKEKLVRALRAAEEQYISAKDD